MSELYLVRHGQASFGADDYDNLSQTGRQQTDILCEFWRNLDARFDAIYSGSLKRQVATARGLLPQVDDDEIEVLKGFDEYVARSILETYRKQYARSDGFAVGDDFSREMKDRRAFQQVLERACQRWVQGELESGSVEPFSLFKQRVGDALNEVMAANGKGRRVVVATSGGVIAAAVQSLLAIPDKQAINLNWVVFNTSVTRIRFSGSRRSLSIFNGIPHLERPGLTDKITFR